MKIIVSHDIDHLTAREHTKTLLFKFLIRGTIEVILRTISVREYITRFKSIFITNKWQNINEIMDFNNKNNIPATFFIGVANGMGLEYSLSNSLAWAKHINKQGFDLGVHGISFDNKEDMQVEYDLLQSHLNQDVGMRMHYLRTDDKTMEYISEIGYLFDTTISEDKNPYKINDMWEFPLHIMEVNIFYPNKEKWLTKSLDEYKKYTKKRVKELDEKNINYMTLLFHDRYFDDSHICWRDWYIWLIGYLKEEGHTFISYKDAIRELEYR